MIVYVRLRFVDGSARRGMGKWDILAGGIAEGPLVACWARNTFSKSIDLSGWREWRKIKVDASTVVSPASVNGRGEAEGGMVGGGVDGANR